MAEESPGEQKSNTGDSSQRRMQQPKLCRRHFFEKAADPADAKIRQEERDIIDADDGAGERRRRDARVERKRNRKDIGKSSAVQNVKSDQPTDRYFRSRPSCNRCADYQRKHSGNSNKAADGDLANLGRFSKFLRPKPPEQDGDKQKADRDDRIERDQP